LAEYRQKVVDAEERLEKELKKLKNLLGPDEELPPIFTEEYPKFVNEQRIVKAQDEPAQMRNSEQEVKAIMLTEFRKHFYSNAHTKKLRRIQVNPTDPKFVVTTALDGCVRFWDFTREGSFMEKGVIEKGLLRNQKNPTDLCFNDAGTHLAVAFQDGINDHQLIVLRTDTYPKLQTKFMEEKPHRRDLTTVACVHTTKFPAWITASLDHSVVMWYTPKKKTKTRLLHQLHTSAVNSLYTSPNDDIFTGSQDKRLICWSLDPSKEIFRQQLTAPVNSIIASPINPKLLLLGQQSKRDQLMIFDIRLEKSVINLNWVTSANQIPTQYMTPSFSPNGCMVSCGSVDNRISIWDIRFPKVYAPTQSFELHTKRVTQTLFHPVWDDWLLTISSDRSIGYHSFKMK